MQVTDLWKITDSRKDIGQPQFKIIQFMGSPILASESVIRSGIKTSVQETLFTPRFYTTDFDAAAQMDWSRYANERESM